MRLVSPSVGECADRMTILELKMYFGNLRGLVITHFEEEYQAIKDYLGEKNPVGSDNYRELQIVNKSLWDLEGFVRAKVSLMENAQESANCLTQITRLNDRRAELVNLLDGAPAKEKLY